MEFSQWLAVGIFAVTILVVVTNVIDSTLAAMIGVTVMIWLGVMSEDDAFKYVDWNVMAILVSIWLIAGYFGKSGVPSWLSVQALKLSGGRPGLLVMILTFLAGVISMFVDNVVTILMMAPVALPLGRARAEGAVGGVLPVRDWLSGELSLRSAAGDNIQLCVLGDPIHAVIRSETAVTPIGPALGLVAMG